jgi:hypothetical protein
MKTKVLLALSILFTGSALLRAQTFNLQPVLSGADYEKVAILPAGTDLPGLVRVDAFSAKAKGLTLLAGAIQVRERALKKLRMKAAMRGCNAVIVTEQSTVPNQALLALLGPAPYSLQSGVGYNSQAPDVQKFIQLIGDKKVFSVIQRQVFYDNSRELMVEDVRSKWELGITSVEVKDGAVEIIWAYESLPSYMHNKPSLSKSSRPELVGFNDKSFTIFFTTHKGKLSHNLVLAFGE